MKRLFTICLIIMISTADIIFSQEIGVIAGLTKGNKVMIRWFSSETFNVDGVNVYRKEIHQNEWTKLNSAPIKKMEKVSPGTKDTTLAIFSALLYNTISAEDDETIKLSILAKCLTDTKFANAFGMQYEDVNVKPGEIYEYKVAKIKGADEEYNGISERITIQDYIAPAAPLNFSGDAQDGIITLKWNKDEEKFFAYNIYRGESLNDAKSLVNSIPIFIFEFQDSSGNYKTMDFFYKDTALSNGKTYYYELTGMDYLGMESKRSNTISLTPKDLTPPPAPFNLKNRVSNNEVLISWSCDNVNDLKGFVVYRSPRYEGPFTKLNQSLIPAGDTSFTDKLQNPEERYYYYLTAEDYSANQSRSVIMAVVIPDQIPPSRPEDLLAAGDTGLVRLSWKKGVEKDLLGYFIYRSVSGDEEDFVLLNPRPVNTGTYVDTLKKEAKNSFIYRIMAVDKKYNQSEYSSTVNVKLKDAVPPSAPILLSVNVDDNIISLNWTQTDLTDAAGLFIFRSKETDKNAVQLNKNVILPSVTIMNDTLQEAGLYNYYLIAVDSAGNNSPRSNSMTVEYTGIHSLSPVEDLKAEMSQDKTRVTLSWKPLDSKNLLGYVVFREEQESSDFVNSISSLQQETTFTDTMLVNSNSFYCIKAFDSFGNISVSKMIKP